MEDGFGPTLCTPQKGVTMAHLIGIDVGGTSIKAGLFSGDGKLLGVKSVPTGALDNAEEFAKVNAGLHELIESYNVDVADIVGVGLDVPGPVDSLGNVGMLANIKLDAAAFSDAISFSSGSIAQPPSSAAISSSEMPSSRFLFTRITPVPLKFLTV